MSILGYAQRIKDFFARGDKERQEAGLEAEALQEELQALQNEARFQEEPSFQSHLLRLSNDLERYAKALIYEMKEPARTTLQGRCQMLTEEIGRPDAVKARAVAIAERLEQLRGVLSVPDAGVTGARDDGDNGQ